MEIFGVGQSKCTLDRSWASPSQNLRFMRMAGQWRCNSCSEESSEGRSNVLDGEDLETW